MANCPSPNRGSRYSFASEVRMQRLIVIFQSLKLGPVDTHFSINPVVTTKNVVRAVPVRQRAGSFGLLD